MLLVNNAKHVVADADHIGDETMRFPRPGDVTCNHHGSDFLACKALDDTLWLNLQPLWIFV
jgi:hypothetical protein